MPVEFFADLVGRGHEAGGVAGPARRVDGGHAAAGDFLGGAHDIEVNLDNGMGAIIITTDDGTTTYELDGGNWMSTDEDGPTPRDED